MPDRRRESSRDAFYGGRGKRHLPPSTATSASTLSKSQRHRRAKLARKWNDPKYLPDRGSQPRESQPRTRVEESSSMTGSDISGMSGVRAGPPSYTEEEQDFGDDYIVMD